MPVDDEDVLKEMVAAAHAAAAVAQRHFRRHGEAVVEVKGPGDFVSEADREAERVIRDRLLARHPAWSVTGEELPSVEGDAEHRFLVDPIDGTTNFLSGMDYTISIALRRDQVTVAGALLNPVRDEMFTALRGRGAWLNGERLMVSDRTDVGLMVVGTGLPTPNLHSHAGFHERLDRLRAPIGAVRILGSSANSCAHVAAGRLTGYFEESGLLDWAVGVLLVQEAGGVVTDWWGRGPEHYEASGMVIAANPATHAYLLEALTDAPMKP